MRARYPPAQHLRTVNRPAPFVPVSLTFSNQYARLLTSKDTIAQAEHTRRKKRMQAVRIAKIMDALGIAGRTTTNLVRGLPTVMDGRHRAVFLPDLLPRLSGKYAHAAPALLAASIPSGRSYVGADVQGAGRLEQWLLIHGSDVHETVGRLGAVRRLLVKGLAETDSTLWLGDIEHLRAMVIRTPEALGFILTGDRSHLPADPATWARRFFLLHASPAAVRGGKPQVAA